MHYKNLSNLKVNIIGSPSSRLYHSNNLQNRKHKIAAPQGITPQLPSKLSKIDLYQKNHNIRKSNRLFEKAHKIDAANRQTYLCSETHPPQNNHTKIEYLLIHCKNSKIGPDAKELGQNLKLKRLRLSLEPKKQIQQLQEKITSFQSSLTVIILNECRIKEGTAKATAVSSARSQILCPDQNQQIPRVYIDSVDNPYELLKIRRRKDKKQNRKSNFQQ